MVASAAMCFLWIVISSLLTQSINSSCVAISSIYGMIEMLSKIALIIEFVKLNNLPLFVVTVMVYVIQSSISLWYNSVKFSVLQKIVKDMTTFQ